MGVRSSSTKNRQWVITRRKCLNRTVSAQAPTLDVKLAGVALLMLGIILECGPTLQASVALVPCSTRIKNHRTVKIGGTLARDNTVLTKYY